MILGAGRAQRSHRGTHHCHRLSGPGTVAVRSPRPIDRILQNAGNRVVVLRSDDEYRVGASDLLFEFYYLCWRIRFVVLAESGQTIDLKDVDSRACWCQLLSSSQGRAIVRALPQAPSNTQYDQWIVHDRYLLLCPTDFSLSMCDPPKASHVSMYVLPDTTTN